MNGGNTLIMFFISSKRIQIKWIFLMVSDETKQIRMVDTYGGIKL